MVQQWLDQACRKFFDTHVKVIHENSTSEASRRLECCGGGVIDEAMLALTGRSVVEESDESQ